MTILGFALVLAAACCHATWNFFVKRINGGPELVWLFSVISVALYLPLAILVIIRDRPDFGALQIAFIVGSVLLHLAYFLLLQQGYRRGDLSLIYPTARATGPFLSTLAAMLLLGEQMTLQRAAGGAAVIVGVLCLTGGFRRGAKPVTASLIFGIGAGVLIGSYTVWDAYAVATLLVPPLLLDYVSSVGRSFLLAPIALRRRRSWPRIGGSTAAASSPLPIFNPLAYILVLYALTFTPVVYVAPIREVSVLITVLMGGLLLQEGDLRRRLGWAALILSGVILLASG